MKMENIELENLKQVKIQSKNNLLKKEKEVQACKKNIIMLKKELQSIKDSRENRLSLNKLANKLAAVEYALIAITIAGTVVICKDVNMLLGFLNLSFVGPASYIGMVLLYDKISKKRIEKEEEENNTNEIIEFKNKKLNHEKTKYLSLKKEQEKLCIIYEEDKNKYMKEKNSFIKENTIDNEENIKVESKAKSKVKKLEK